MGTTLQAITQSIQHGELQAFGLAMPRLAPDWSPSGATGTGFTVNETTMTITSSANWAAPLDMSFQLVDPSGGKPMPVTLVQAGGTVEIAGGVLLNLFEQQWLRLGRLYTQVLETNNANRPEFGRGLPYRPVLKFVFFPGQSISPASGMAEAWADLGFAGDARFYDIDGLPIDPVAVMAAFTAILTKFSALQAVDLTDSPLSTIPLSNYLSSLASPTITRIRFAKADGTAYDGTHLTGVTAVESGSGIYKLTGTSVGLDAVSGTTFTQYDHDRLLFGPGTAGRLMGTFTPPTLGAGVTLSRDFYSLRVLELDKYLIGDWPSTDPATTIQRRPTVRINENAILLANGNDVFASISQALPSGADPAISVAQAIDGNFSIPSTPGTSARWPLFPGVTVDASATLPASLKSQLTFTSNWATTGDLTKADVVLQIDGLPANAWVRVYPRKFLPDAMLERGDGEGRQVPSSGPLSVYLIDPFSLKAPGNPDAGDIIVPAKATLMFDLAVTLANGTSRIYGNNTTDVGPAPAPAVTPPAGTNPCGTAAFRGISNSGILGLGTLPVASPPGNLKDWVLALTGETQPRDASRLPTMARRELLVAGLASNVWKGVIGGGRILPEGLSVDTRIGAPGSLGGRETSVTGANTSGGILAYDIARHAFRRSLYIVSRLGDLSDNKWNVPAEPAQVALGGTPSATNGTMAGALLQTVAPFCETPELYDAWAAGVNVNTAIEYAIDHFIPPGLPLHDQVVNAIRGLETTPAAPAAATESNAEQRMAVELEREVTSVFFGRRDAQWALKSAIATARHLIYIETPGFDSTVGTSSTGYAADLIDALKTQMTSHPGLRVIICVPKNPDFAPGYEGMATYEVQDRLLISQGRTAAPPVTPLPPTQALIFHPIGFPGRFSRVETNVVIVDDCWTMIGGASIRRRGLTMDGSSDLVLTDTLIEDGRSAAIRDYRRVLMANRLGVTTTTTDPSYVALDRADTAFHLVKDALAGAGLGDITGVWDGVTPGLTPATALPVDQANPDGRDLDYGTALLIAAFGAASGV